jgi:nucleoside phosphorylase
MAADREPDVLLVAAHPPELSGLRPWLGAELHAEMGGIEVLAEPVGIGLSAAAGGMAALLDRLRPRALVLIGTCGAYPGRGPDLGQVVVAGTVHLVSAAVALGQGAFPDPRSTAIDTDPALSAGIGGSGLRSVDVATTLAITVDDGLCGQIGRREGCHVEHLEAFAVAEQAAPRRVPFACVLGVANRCGGAAREQWRANHGRVGDDVARHVAAWLERGAPGLRPIQQ